MCKGDSRLTCPGVVLGCARRGNELAGCEPPCSCSSGLGGMPDAGVVGCEGVTHSISVFPSLSLPPETPWAALDLGN